MNTQTVAFLDLLKSPVQYVVPLWQRRYCWRESDIRRLVDDLVTVATAPEESARHYGGTLLTFPLRRDPTTMVSPYRVVDGQQRLTTVSILLDCITDWLIAREEEVGDWTGPAIRHQMLRNPVGDSDRRYKLRLQDGDHEEFQAGMKGDRGGPGSVAHAWRVARRLVNSVGAEALLVGLQRLRVVSITLGSNDDPQQVFESLNATGRPLTESEKLKNWLLIGLSDSKQKALHDKYWVKMEEHLQLHAGGSSGTVEWFLRDFLRWKTGELRGLRQTYEGFRRWAVRNGMAENRKALCRDLTDAAKIYGMFLPGGASYGDDAEVEAQLAHLRAMGLDTFRPFALRLFYDLAKEKPKHHESLASVLKLISTWITRFWLADLPTNSLNRAFVDLAHEPGPDANSDVPDFWKRRIERLRGTRVAVPSDEDVRSGVASRRAYGARVGRSTKAVLCALMETEKRQRNELPDPAPLTLEHIMPQKLTPLWKRALGRGPDEVHELYRHKLANITLTGVNSELGNMSWAKKRRYFRESGVPDNRRIAKEDMWNQDAMERRASRLSRSFLEMWPWEDQGPSKGKLAWRFKGEEWREEATIKGALLNVAAALIDSDDGNGERLCGSRQTLDLQFTENYPPRDGMDTVPGWPKFTIYTNSTTDTATNRIKSMGEACGMPIQVRAVSIEREFWEFMMDEYQGLPGQTDAWWGPAQWLPPVNQWGDRVGVSQTDTRVYVYIRGPRGDDSSRRRLRMLRASAALRDQMPDQVMEPRIDDESNAAQGRTAALIGEWYREDRGEWPEMARWIIDQVDRMEKIAKSLDSPDDGRREE